MQKIYLLAFLLICCSCLYGQKNGSIKGTTVDTILKKPVPACTITVLEKKDSSLVTFTQTDNQGRFELKGIPAGEYRLLITHVNYHNSNQFFTISEERKNIDLGEIRIDDKTKVLEEVIVSNEAPPVTLVDDTVQYNAGSFKTAPNANVEQLLKKLPGVKVEKDGTVKAQGEKVNRVLVDGKEFFGTDPKIATKNLPADAVDKVQVYDRQSDQAQLTGFEDGNYEKTINLKLKKDKKKGVFGKVSAGEGTNNRYEGRFNVNSFKGARQFSAIGMGNNTNVEGFTFMDIINFTGGLSKWSNGANGGNINIRITEQDVAEFGLGGNGNTGIRTAWGGGLNYNNIIGDKLDFQSSYFYNRFNPVMKSDISREYFLPDSSYFYQQHSNANNLNNSHRLNLNMLYQIDSMNSIRITPSFSYQNTSNRSKNNYQTLTRERSLANEGFSNADNDARGFNFRNDIIYRKKFKRKGRTLSLSLQANLNESKGNGSLVSINQFFNPDGSRIKSDTLDQQNHTEGDLRAYTGRLVYTEPVWRKSLIELSISRSNTKSTAEKLTYDYNKFNQKYQDLNELLSNDFENTYNYTRAGLRMRTQKRKYNYSFGLGWQQSDLKGRISFSGAGKDSVIWKTFRTLLPVARFQYNFTRSKTLSLNYSTSTNQPSISQLQPVTDNSNPLNIIEGNPNLKEEYVHTLTGSMNLMNPFKNKNLFLFFNFQATHNKIVNDDAIDGFGIKTTRPVNVNGVLELNSNISYSLPVRPLKGSFEMTSDINYYKGKQFINGAGNQIRTVSWAPGVRLDMTPVDKLNLGVSASVRINHSAYSLRPDMNINYLSQDYEGFLDWEMRKGFFFATDFTVTINNQLAAGFNESVPIWNASVSKQVLKFNRGEIKLRAIDLLNRNVGITRSSNQNFVEDSRYNTLRRFLLLSFTYNLTKTGMNSGGPGQIKLIGR